jgi:periplasmic protein TonB
MTGTAIRFRDDPWSRLPWLVPAALILTLLSQIGFLSLLRQPANQSAVPRPVDVQIVELPVTMTPPAPPPPARRPPPPVKPRAEPLPRPTPPQPEARVELPRDPTPPAAEEPMAQAPAAAATVPVPATPAAPGTVVGPPTQAPVAALPSPPAPQAAPPSAQIPARITQPARPRGGYQVRPAYPAAARQARAEGTTLLRVHIRADGTIDDVQVSRSAGHAALDEAAAAAVTRWRFEPARSGSEAVAVWVLIPFEFRLQTEN